LLQRVFKALSYRDFRLMWTGACVSQIGTFMQQYAQSWVVYDMTKDPFYLGLDLFLGQLPIMLLSLVGGVFADRTDRRKLLLMSQYIQISCAFTLTALFFFNAVKIWEILALSFVVGLGQSFGGPAYAALLPSLVDSEDLSNAIAMNSIQFNLGRIIGPTLGGFAFTALGPTWCFGLNGVSYLAVIATLYIIQVKFVPPKTKERISQSMKEGFRFIRARDGLAPLVVLAFLMTLLGFQLTGFLPVFVRDVFKRGPETYTILLVCSGAGSVLGGLIVAFLGNLKRQGRASLLIMIALGVLIAAFALSTSLPLSCVLIFAGGAAVMSSSSLLVSLVQLIVGDDMRGRVMSVYNMAIRSGISLGPLALGKLIPLFGLSTTIAWTGSILIALALYFLLMHRRVTAL
jgi:predicted MFS family arabinose efflux permease